MGKKRSSDAVGIAAEGRSTKKRKSAEASKAKISKIADDELSSDVLEAESDGGEEIAVSSLVPASKPRREKKAEEMPLVAKGVRLWEDFKKTVAGTDLEKLSRFEAKIEDDADAVEVQRSYGFTLKPVMLTEGPLAGQRVLVVQNTQAFRFMDLPPEIRNKIYGSLLEESAPIGIDAYHPVRKETRSVRSSFVAGSYVSRQGLTWDKSTCKWIGQGPTPLALLRVSKQMLHETAPIVYGNNVFKPDSFSDANLFLDKIGGMHRYLRHLRLPTHTHGISSARSMFNKLKDATNLSSIRVCHSMLCRESYGYRYRMNSDRLAHATAPLFKALKKDFEKSGKRPARDVLGIIQADDERNSKCYRCQENNIHGTCVGCAGSNCKTKCVDLAAHVAELAAGVRTAVTKTLGMEE